MKNQQAERLSVLVDDELATQQLMATIELLLEDEGAKKLWTRYHLIGDAMRRNLPEYVGNIAEQVEQRLPAQKIPVFTLPSRQYRFIRPLLACAIASTVLVIIALFNLPYITQQDIVVEDRVVVVPKGIITQSDMLNRYLVNHNEYRMNMYMNMGVSPHARLVADNEVGLNQ